MEIFWRQISQYVYHFGYTKDTNKPQIKSLVQGAAEALRGPWLHFQNFVCPFYQNFYRFFYCSGVESFIERENILVIIVGN